MNALHPDGRTGGTGGGGGDRGLWRRLSGVVLAASICPLLLCFSGAMLFPRCDEIKRNNSSGSFVEFATKDPTASPRLLAALDGRSDAAIQPVE